jgi:uncharacterized protein
MRKLLLYGLILLSLSSFSQEYKDKRISIGKVDSIYSNILKEKRKICIYLPSKPSSAKLPVLYLLDGEANFHSMTGIVQQLSEVNGNMVLPEMLVVGIASTDRIRDLTPTHSKVTRYSDDNEFLNPQEAEQTSQHFCKKNLYHILKGNILHPPTERWWDILWAA